MKFSCVFVLIALPGIFGAHHHVHHVTIADCFGHACGDLESRCLIKEERGHLRPHCAEPHMCKHQCTSTTQVGHDGCCCDDQACVNNFKSGQTAVLQSTVRCKDCHDIRSGDCTHTTICHGDESCLLHFLDHRVESYCAPKHDCEHNPVHHAHGIDKTICCHDDACVAAATSITVQNLTFSQKPVETSTAAAASVHTCADADDTGYCPAFAHQICTSFDYITHQHAVTYCANTCNFCVEFLAMMGHTTAMKTQPPPPTTQPLPTTEKTTQVPTTTHLCKDHDTTGYCGDFKDTICTSVDFNVHQEAVMKCAETCNFCFEYLAYMSQTTKPTMPKVTTTAVPPPTTTETPLPTTQSTTEKPLPTTQPTTQPPPTTQPTTKPVPSTIATTAATPACIDSDTTGYCQANAMTICTSFDFAVHQEAVKKCADTCNFCTEYIALFMQTNSQTNSVQTTTAEPVKSTRQTTQPPPPSTMKPIVTSTTVDESSTVNLVPASAAASMAPVVNNNPSFAAPTSLPTTTHLCKDQDTTGFCAANASHICTSFDLNVHQEAVKKCADTCNFCVEYLILYHPTTTAEPITTTKYIPTVATTTVSPSTSVPTTTKLCTDKDTTGYCAANAARLCTSFDFNVHQEAVMKCADTCNFCVEYLILNNQSP